MVSTGKFLLQMLQTKDAPILLDAIILGKYTESTIVCSGVLVDFKFSIDYAVSLLDRNKYAVLWIFSS